MVIEKELWILIWFLLLKEPFLAASASAYDTDSKGAASLSLRSPSSKWLIAPSTIVFIQIICYWKRFNLLELISYSCWNTSKCSKRELSKLSPHGACREGSCHLSPWRAALRFFLWEICAFCFSLRHCSSKILSLGSQFLVAVAPGIIRTGKNTIKL